MESRAELLGRAGNYGLVQLDGRQFPALAVQGDSVKVLHEATAELVGALAARDAETAEWAVREIAATVGSMLAAFEAMSRAAGRPLPYR